MGSTYILFSWWSNAHFVSTQLINMLPGFTRTNTPPEIELLELEIFTPLEKEKNIFQIPIFGFKPSGPSAIQKPSVAHSVGSKYCTSRRLPLSITRTTYPYLSVRWEKTLKINGWNMSSWRFGSDHLPFFSWVMAGAGSSLFHLPGFRDSWWIRGCELNIWSWSNCWSADSWQWFRWNNIHHFGFRAVRNSGGKLLPYFCKTYLSEKK